MHIIKKKAIEDFVARFPESRSPFFGWYRVLLKASPRNLMELREYCRSADQVGELYVFNIGGNNYRLIAAIHFNRQKLFIRHVLTHDEYDRGGWK